MRVMARGRRAARRGWSLWSAAMIFTICIVEVTGYCGAFLRVPWGCHVSRLQASCGPVRRLWLPRSSSGLMLRNSGNSGWPLNSVWDTRDNSEREESEDAEDVEYSESRGRSSNRGNRWQNSNYQHYDSGNSNGPMHGQYNQATDNQMLPQRPGSNPAGLPEIQLDAVNTAYPGTFVRRSERAVAQPPDLQDGSYSSALPSEDSVNQAGEGLGPAASREAQAGHVPHAVSGAMTGAAAPGSIAVPIKAMYFVDGTWLFYSFFSRGRFRCPIINKFGSGWLEEHRVDWGGLRDAIRDELSDFLPGRLVDVIRVVVFGSVRRDTHPSSARIRMFKDMQQAGFEVHLLTHSGEQEKCVDISLAVEMMHYASVAEGFEVGVLVTGDKDFMPAMSRVRQKGRRLVLATVRTSCNRDLLDRNKHVYDFHPVLLEDSLEKFIVPRMPDAVAELDAWQVQQELCDIVVDCLSKDEDGGRRSLRDVGRFLQANAVQGHNALTLVRNMFRNLRTFLDEWPDLFTVQGNDLVLVTDKDRNVFKGRRNGPGQTLSEELDEEEASGEEMEGERGRHEGRGRGRAGAAGKSSWTIKRVGRADIKVGGRRDGGSEARAGGGGGGGMYGDEDEEGGEELGFRRRGHHTAEEEEDVGEEEEEEEEEEEPMGSMVHPSVLQDLKVLQLRMLLKERGCKVTGTKQELIDRLMQDGLGQHSQ